MRSRHLLLSIFLSISATAALSQPILTSGLQAKVYSVSRLLQRPFFSNVPSSSDSPLMPDPSAGSDLIISDVIGKERSINIFAGFTRDVDPVSNRLEDQTQNSTILAPLNSAIQKLPRKPWEDSKDYNALGASAYRLGDGEQRAHDNLRRFVEAHIVPSSPWKEGEKRNTMEGNEVWWEMKDGKKMVQPGDIAVSSVASRVANGEVWIIEGVLNQES